MLSVFVDGSKIAAQVCCHWLWRCDEVGSNVWGINVIFYFNRNQNCCIRKKRWTDISCRVKAFSYPDEEWCIFRLASLGELPSHDGGFSGIIITGSHYNTRDDPPFQAKLIEFLQTCHHANSPNIVGICYGHQVIAKAFGGIVNFNKSNTFVLKGRVSFCCRF